MAGVTEWRHVSCAATFVGTLAGVVSISTIVGPFVGVDTRTKAMAEPVVETASCVRKFAAVELSPEMSSAEVGVKVTAADLRSKQQRSGTTSTVTLDEVVGAAGVGADTDMVTSWLWHCIEQVVGVQAARTPSTVFSMAWRGAV